ncbi:MAG: acyltransferase [Sphingobium sp. 32-64-5]|nr:MAG: acyltransferase [Sphingobium sp. 32-64-5]
MRAVRRRLVELDALRGIGAIAVVLYHLTVRYPEIFPDVAHVPFSFWPGEYRVLLFFAISGFSIFFSFRRIDGIADFAVNRFARLFPTYWLAILLVLLFEYAGDVDRLKIPLFSTLLNFTMLQAYFLHPEVDGAYWTLAVELGFYASMIALWRMLGPSMKRLEWALIPWLGLKWLMLAWPDMPWRLTMVLVLEFLPFFVIGILYYRIWSGERRWTAQIPYLLATLITLYGTDTRDMFLTGCALILIFAAMLAGRLRFLGFGPLLWVGRASYPLYLVHENISFVIMLKATERGWNPWLGFWLAIVTVVLLGWLLHRYVELPANRWIMKKWQARKHAAPVAAAEAVSAA